MCNARVVRIAPQLGRTMSFTLCSPVLQPGPLGGADAGNRHLSFAAFPLSSPEKLKRGETLINTIVTQNLRSTLIIILYKNGLLYFRDRMVALGTTNRGVPLTTTVVSQNIRSILIINLCKKTVLYSFGTERSL